MLTLCDLDHYMQ